MNQYDVLSKLVSIGPRVGANETKAYQLLQLELERQNIKYELQPFTVDVPIVKKAELIVDGDKLPCLGSSIVSGSIPDGKYLISHFGYSGESTPYNIAYSPTTDSISVVDHFRVPSITISRKSITKVVMASSISGMVEVEKFPTATGNILVGNTSNPRNIVFAHFDSIIGQGAIDNAGSVAVMMQVIIDHPELVSNTLFIFSGNEEMCYDEYKLSGYGFRVFENDYSELLSNAEHIVVIDGVGMSEANFTQSGIDWVLQLRMIDQIKNKVYWLQNDQTPILKVFHTVDDVIQNISELELDSAKNLLVTKLSG